MKIKKIISLFLAATMLFGVAALGTTAFATDSTEYAEGVYRYTVSNGEAKITNVFGIYDDTTLPSTLGGYPVTSIGASAIQYERGLVNVTIPACIETIESGAFYYCDVLESVTFEDNSKLKSLGDTVFGNCFVLETVDFGENSILESIGGSAFVHCKALDGMVIPDTVTSIGSTAFEGCLSLSEINIPAGATSIGSAAFKSCASLEKINIDESNPNYASDMNGVVFNKEKTKIILYPAGSKKTEYVIPDYVTEIEQAAFQGAKNLEEVIWNNPDLIIGMSAFSDCTGLYRVTIPEGTTYLNDWIFNACFSLTEVNLPESLELIDCGAFHWCTSLEQIELPSGLKQINDNAFKECESLKSIIFPEGLEKIYSSAFEKCYSLESVSIPESVEYIGATAFYQCFSLKEIVFPEGVKTLNDSVVRYGFALEDITIPDSVETIQANAFMDCRALKTLTIPVNVKSVTGRAFTNCTAFESVVVDADNAYFTAGSNGILFNKNGTKLVYYPANKAEKVYAVPDTVTSIGTYAFCNAQNVAAVVIPDSVTAIEAAAFYGNNIRDIYFEGTQEEWNAFAAATDTSNPVTANVHFNYSGTDHVHEYSQSITTAPTCSANGKKLYTCSCGESVEIDYHYGTGKMMCAGGNYEWVAGSDGDCLQAGQRSYCCDKCGFAFAVRDTAKSEHNMQITASDSEISFECTECGYAYSEEIPEGAGYIHYKGGEKERAHIYSVGDKIVTPPTPEKEGCTFFGWKDENGNYVELGTMPNKNMELTEVFGKILEEKNFDVTATFEEGCFDEEVSLSVKELDGTSRLGGIFMADGNRYREVGFFNIKTVNENSETVQPENGKKVTVKFPIPEGYSEKDEFIITHWFTGGGREKFTTADGGNALIENGYIIIEVGEFSEFSIHVKSKTSVSKLPSKTSYNYKESLDLSGIELTVVKEDGTTEKVTDTSKMTVSGYDSSKIGEQTVTVEYEGESVEFTVTVNYAWWQWIIRILLLGFLWY